MPKNSVFHCIFEIIEIQPFTRLFIKNKMQSWHQFYNFMQTNLHIKCNYVCITYAIPVLFSFFLPPSPLQYYSPYFFILCCRFCLTMPKSLAVLVILPSFLTRCCCITVLSMFSRYFESVEDSLENSDTSGDVWL